MAGLLVFRLLWELVGTHGRCKYRLLLPLQRPEAEHRHQQQPAPRGIPPTQTTIEEPDPMRILRHDDVLLDDA